MLFTKEDKEGVRQAKELAKKIQHEESTTLEDWLALDEKSPAPRDKTATKETWLFQLLFS